MKLKLSQSPSLLHCWQSLSFPCGFVFQPTVREIAVDIVIMSSNNDNIMARFLFAILQQKNLKDVRPLRGFEVDLEDPGR